ncbi:uncharacterized protein G6M90_00g062050 [Metarhizium brunneum]|uniref:Uncharacterized protein n=1 Tax=Metarhizium brunneum TaxID=500148 RepID=A0A7D5UYX0_9HYPO|nr:hypothetical protein G6M90_00g062050 [Metarhizium brunneum]
MTNGKDVMALRMTHSQQSLYPFCHFNHSRASWDNVAGQEVAAVSTVARLHIAVVCIVSGGKLARANVIVLMVHTEYMNGAY